MFLIGPYSYPPGTMLSAIQRVGLTSGLKLCLDAGDIASYNGTSQVWSDTSGGGYDFNRGSGSGSDAADPTFNGTAGRQSSGEYFSFDGADWFTYNSANETWMQNIHKDNAKWAFAAWVWIPAPAVAVTVFGDNDNHVLRVGFEVAVQTDGSVAVTVSNGSAISLNVAGSGTISFGAWAFIAAQVDEAAGTGFLQANATQDSVVMTYSSPSAAAATYTLQLGCAGNATQPLPNTSRINAAGAWEGTVPSAAQLLSLYNSTKGKFGL